MAEGRSAAAFGSRRPAVVGPVWERRGARLVLAGLVGVAAGALAWMFATQMSGKWAAYLTAALVLAAAAPAVIPALGGVRRLAIAALMVALILEVDWFVNFRARPYPGGVNGLGMNMMVLAGACYTLHRGGHRVFAGGRPWCVDRQLALAALAFLAATVLSVVGAVDQHQWLYGLFLNLSVVFVALVACDLGAGASDRELRLMWRVLFCALLVESLIVLLQNALGFSFSLKGEVYSRFGEAGRYSGTFTTPSATGTFLAVGLFFALVELVTGCAGERRWLTVSALATGVVALLLTETRTAWIAFAGGAAALLVWLRRAGGVTPRQLGVLAALAAVALSIAGPVVMTRLSNDHSSDFEVRWNLALIAFQIIKAHPLFGVGVNTCSLVVTQYVPPGWPGHWVFVTHNQFLLMAAEAGLPGLAALVAVFAAGLRAVRGAAQWSRPLHRETGVIVRVTLWSLVWALSFDFVQGAQTYYLVFFFIGLAAGLARAIAPNEMAITGRLSHG